MTDLRLRSREPFLSSTAWQQVVDGAIDTAIISTDLDGQVTTWNSGAVSIFCWSSEEMLGESLERIFDDTDRQQGRLQREMADAVATGRGGGDEGWRLRKDGSRFW